jgi:hypothetical protein
MDKDTALKLALEALETCDFVYTYGNGGYQQFDRPSVDKAITAIMQALAARQEHEPENEPHVSLASVQEPVAWMQSDEVHISLWKDDYHTIPLYTTPPAAQRQWVGLTDEDWKELHLTTNARTYGPAIEAKLKEKNT